MRTFTYESFNNNKIIKIDGSFKITIRFSFSFESFKAVENYGHGHHQDFHIHTTIDIIYVIFNYTSQKLYIVINYAIFQ